MSTVKVHVKELIQAMTPDVHMQPGQFQHQTPSRFPEKLLMIEERQRERYR